MQHVDDNRLVGDGGRTPTGYIGYGMNPLSIDTQNFRLLDYPTVEELRSLITITKLPIVLTGLVADYVTDGIYHVAMYGQIPCSLEFLPSQDKMNTNGIPGPSIDCFRLRLIPNGPLVPGRYMIAIDNDDHPISAGHMLGIYGPIYISFRIVESFYTSNPDRIAV